jgi:hypothetical protein
VLTPLARCSLTRQRFPAPRCSVSVFRCPRLREIQTGHQDCNFGSREKTDAHIFRVGGRYNHLKLALINFVNFDHVESRNDDEIKPRTAINTPS